MKQPCATVTMHVVAQVSAERPCVVVLRLDWVTGFRKVPVAVIAAYARGGWSCCSIAILKHGNCDNLLGRVLSLHSCCLYVKCSKEIRSQDTVPRVESS